MLKHPTRVMVSPRTTNPSRVSPFRSAWQRHRPPRYPVWSASSIALAGGLAAVVASVSVFLLGHKSFFVETEISLAIVAVGLFVFLAVGLYRGARVSLERLDMRPETLPEVPDLGLFDLVGGDDPVSFILSIVFSIVVSILLALLAWLLLSMLWGLLIVAALAVFWVFNRALRQVFARSRQCQGKLGPSLGYALLYTSLYTGWLFVLAWIIHRIAKA